MHCMLFVLGKTSTLDTAQIDVHPLGLAITGMLIVFSALSLIALFIAALPRIMDHVNRILPPPRDHAVTGASQSSSPSSGESVADETVVAIAAAMRARR